MRGPNAAYLLLCDDCVLLLFLSTCARSGWKPQKRAFRIWTTQPRVTPSPAAAKRAALAVFIDWRPSHPKAVISATGSVAETSPRNIVTTPGKIAVIASFSKAATMGFKRRRGLTRVAELFKHSTKTTSKFWKECRKKNIAGVVDLDLPNKRTSNSVSSSRQGRIDHFGWILLIFGPFWPFCESRGWYVYIPVIPGNFSVSPSH